MIDLNPNQRIYDVMEAIQRGTYRIPSIQRGYEWDRERVVKLFDSIMSGYPIGAIMVWWPPESIRSDIPTRSFTAEYKSTVDYLSDEPHPAQQQCYLVLDGQQRLESLYLGFFGSYDGERLYLQLDHVPTDIGGDTDYRFEFLAPEEARRRPEMIHLAEIIKLDADTKADFARGLAERLASSDSEARHKKEKNIFRNVDRLLDRFNMRSSLLFQEVERRHDYDHVLEIFERVNSGGMVLGKSDLLFSTLKLKLREMEGKFFEAINFLNQGDRHRFDTDFLIKTSLVMFGQKARYEVSKLKDEAFIQTLKERFHELHTCLRQMSSWLDDVALIKCDRFLRSRLALIPVLDYMMLSGQRDKPDGENGRALTQYLYMAFFRRLFSRAPDNVLDQIHDLIVTCVRDDPKRFPISELQRYMSERQNAPYRLEEYHGAADPDLFINIVDGGRLQRDPFDPSKHSKDLKLEVDHIFPRTPLTNAGLGDVVNHIGNYRLIVMPANRRKRERMPDDQTDFFGRQHERVEPFYQAALADLTRDSFVAFRDARTALMREHVETFLGLSCST